MARPAKSREAIIVEFFRTAPLEVAAAVFGIVQNELKQRTEGSASSGGADQVKPRIFRRTARKRSGPAIAATAATVAQEGADVVE